MRHGPTRGARIGDHFSGWPTWMSPLTSCWRCLDAEVDADDDLGLCRACKHQLQHESAPHLERASASW
jgi:hypothetical protein